MSRLPYDASVHDIVDPGLEAYAEAHTTAPPAYLEGLATELRTTLDSPHMMVGRLEGRFLEMLVFALDARNVLEIGTFGGYSALAMAAGLATLSYLQEHAGEVIRNSKPLQKPSPRA